MVNKHLLQRIELSFWDRVIPLMSESPSAQRLIQNLYTLSQEPRQHPWIPFTLAAFAAAGLGMGFWISVSTGFALW